jgi:hypothetical protein
MNTELTLTSLRTYTPITNRITRANVVDASFSYPVVVTDTDFIIVHLIPMSVLYAIDTVTAFWAMTCIACMPALTSPHGTIFARPVVLTLAFTELVALSIGHADITVASEWTITGAADRVTFEVPVRTVIPTPHWLTNAVPVLVSGCVSNTFNTLVRSLASAPFTFVVTAASICLYRAVFSSPVG